MCKFFSCICTKKGEVFFTEEDSHEEVIIRSGLLDDESENFVRIEYTKEERYRIDEMTIPEWYERIAAMTKRKVKNIFEIVTPAREEYEKIIAPAREEYEKIIAPAREEYLKIIAPAREEYEKITVPTWEEYEKIKIPVWKEYQKNTAPAREEYEKITALACEEYLKITALAWEEYANLLLKIKGYIKRR